MSYDNRERERVIPINLNKYINSLSIESTNTNDIFTYINKNRVSKYYSLEAMRLDIEKDINMLNNINVYSMEENVFVKIGRFLKGLLDKFINFCKMIINKIKGLFNKAKEKVEVETIKKKTEEAVKKSEEKPQWSPFGTKLDFNSPPYSVIGIIRKWDISPDWEVRDGKETGFFELLGDDIEKTIKMMLEDAKEIFESLKDCSNEITKINKKENKMQENESDLMRLRRSGEYIDTWEEIEKTVNKYEDSIENGGKVTFDTFLQRRVHIVPKNTKITIEELYFKTNERRDNEPSYYIVLSGLLYGYIRFSKQPEYLCKFLERIFPKYDELKPIDDRKEQMDSYFQESDKADRSVDAFADQLEKYIKYSKDLANKLWKSLSLFEIDINSKFFESRHLRQDLYSESDIEDERRLTDRALRKFSRLLGVLTKIEGWGFQLLGIRKDFQNMYKEAVNFVLDDILKLMK